MFLDNKYSRIYYNLVSKASKLSRGGYLEKHHIIPKSLGGTNEKSNLVSLTFREHFICHRLLPKFTIGNAKRKMLYALWAMNLKNGKHIRALTSKQYEICKKACSEAASQYRHSQESRDKISKSHKGKRKSEEHCINIGKSSKGRVMPASMIEALVKRISGSGNPRAGKWRVETLNGSTFEINCLNAWCLSNNIKIGTMHKARRENRFHKGFKVNRID